MINKLKEIDAKYPGKCAGATCTGDFAKGDKIIFLGRGRVYHPKCAPADGGIKTTTAMDQLEELKRNYAKLEQRVRRLEAAGAVYGACR